MKKITFLLIMFLGVGIVSAQENEGFSTDYGRNSTFVKNGFWDNWFVGAGAGANVYVGGNFSDPDFSDHITVAPNVQFGSWFNPYYGVRLKASGGALNAFDRVGTQIQKTQSKYVAGELNFMYNLSNYLSNYNSERLYSFIPYLGLGYAYGWDYEQITSGKHVNSLTVDAGLINRFRLTDRIALDVELSGKVVRGEFDQTVSRKGYNGIATASASLVINIGKATFAQAELMNQDEIEALNRKINNQQAEIQNLLNRPVETEREVVEVIKEVIVNKGQEPVNNVVLFAISRTNIEKHQEVNIYNVAKYLKENPEKKVRVVGYTDKATGTVEINNRLSRERAKNVSDLLLNTYKIDPNRVIIQWEGQSQPPFNVPEWDRCVILYIE